MTADRQRPPWSAHSIRDVFESGSSASKTDRYGNTKVAKIRAAYNELRRAIRAGDIEAAERALDRYEPWADFIFDRRQAND